MEINITHIIAFIAVNAFLVLLGYVLVKKKLYSLSWLIAILSIAAIIATFYKDTPAIKMLAIIATTFNGMKILSVIAEYKHKPNHLTFTQWTAFASGWAGMRAAPFQTLGHASLPHAWPKIWFGVSRVLAGLLFIIFAHYLNRFQSTTALFITQSAILLVGLSLILHFGLLSISAGIWRLLGVNVQSLFKKPATALSISEFWGKRWNIAFVEMTTLLIFRPLKQQYGNATAIICVFIFSGLLHELALSVPVNSGYGLPALYFLLQGIMVLVETRLNNKGTRLFKNIAACRLWTIFWLVAPAPLLFHPDFITDVLRPLVGLH